MTTFSCNMNWQIFRGNIDIFNLNDLQYQKLAPFQQAWNYCHRLVNKHAFLKAAARKIGVKYIKWEVNIYLSYWNNLLNHKPVYPTMKEHREIGVPYAMGKHQNETNYTLTQCIVIMCVTAKEKLFFSFEVN